VAESDEARDLREQEIEFLLRKREKLQAQMERLDEQIRALQSDEADGVPCRNGSRKNGRSLREYVVEILSGSHEGLTLAELADQVRAAGYQSASQHFRNVLYQCVYNTKDVFHDESTGTYRMKSIAAKALARHGANGG